MAHVDEVGIVLGHMGMGLGWHWTMWEWVSDGFGGGPYGDWAGMEVDHMGMGC